MKSTSAWHNVEELRREIEGIEEKAGKDIYAHIDTVLTTHSLALAAGASRISATPTAIIMISGFNAEATYVRGLLDAISVKPDFLTCGRYKSTAEILMRKGPSPEAAEECETGSWTASTTVIRSRLPRDAA